MYQLLLCANSVLNTLGQFSLLKRASTSYERNTSHTMTYLQSHTWQFCQLRSHHKVCRSIKLWTSTGVVSGTSLKMMIQRLWFGRTFSPVSSTCTMGEAAVHRNRKWAHIPKLIWWLHFYTTYILQHLIHCNKIWFGLCLTSQDIQNEVHVCCKSFNVLHASNSPDWNKVITVHLGY